KKVSDQKDNTHDSSKNTKFAKQPTMEILSKIGETNALSKPVTSNSVSIPQVSKGVKNANVIASGMFRINPSKTSREEKQVPNTVSASARTKPITVSQPPVITKKNVNSDVNGLSSTGVDKTKTRRPQLRSNIKNDRVPSTSKSSRSKNKEVKVEEHHRNLLLSKKNKHILSAYCLTKMANFLLPVNSRVKLTALMVIMLVPLTQWNLKSNGFQILLLCLAGYPDLFMVRRLRLFQAHDRKSKASHQFLLKVFGNCLLRE
nr:hypothetical protein [Tanacetum cinerariifolium]